MIQLILALLSIPVIAALIFTAPVIDAIMIIIILSTVIIPLAILCLIIWIFVGTDALQVALVFGLIIITITLMIKGAIKRRGRKKIERSALESAPEFRRELYDWANRLGKYASGDHPRPEPKEVFVPKYRTSPPNDPHERYQWANRLGPYSNDED